MEELTVRLWREEQGEALIEYTLFLVLISLVAISSLRNLAFTVSSAYSKAAAAITGCYTPTQADGDRLSGATRAEISSQPGWRARIESWIKVDNDIQKNAIK